MDHRHHDPGTDKAGFIREDGFEISQRVAQLVAEAGLFGIFGFQLKESLVYERHGSTPI
jgi:hypothetical protein